MTSVEVTPDTSLPPWLGDGAAARAALRGSGRRQLLNGVTSTYPTAGFNFLADFLSNSSGAAGAATEGESGIDGGEYGFGSAFAAGSGNFSLEDVRTIMYPGVFNQPPLWEVILKVTSYAIIILLALLGNILVVYVVWSNKRMWTTTNYYIVNLAISDLMVTTSCTWVHLVDDLTEGWVLGAFFCKFNSFAQVLSLVSSIMTLTLISCDRFFGIIFAMKAHMTERRAAIFILVIWICAVGISSPILVYREQFTRDWRDHTEIWCDDTWPHSGEDEKAYPSRAVYYTFISVVLFFVPVLIMTVAYSLIIWRLWSSQPPGERIETDVKAQERIRKKVVIMLVIILCVFAICWIPCQISILYAEHRNEATEPLPDWYHTVYFWANYIAFANSAFNPIIYTGFNNSFRRGFKTMFKRCRKGSRRYNAITGAMTRDTSFRSYTLSTKI